MPDPFRNPNHLPTKICPVCARAFTWRKKWEKDWDNVRYCSDRCRRSSSQSSQKADQSASTAMTGKQRKDS